MATDKTLKTRIALKYDTFGRWNDSPLILLKGELAITTVSQKQTDPDTGELVDFPATVFKVGDGEHTFNNLPWASGLAADVYEWAKKAKPGDAITIELDTSNKAGNAITNIKWDTNKNKILLEKGATFATKAQLDAVDKKIPTGFNITANATDDDVVILTGQGGKNSVSYDAKHAKKGPSAGYTSGNATTSIGAGQSKTIKIPQLTVDTYGHTTAAADQEISITIPSIPSGSGEVKPTDNVSVVDYVKLSGHKLSGSTKKFVGDRGIGITGTADQITVTGPDLSGYATKTYVDSTVAGAVQYYGVVQTAADLGKDMTSSITPKPVAKIGKGDFYRVGQDITQTEYKTIVNTGSRQGIGGIYTGEFRVLLTGNSKVDADKIEITHGKDIKVYKNSKLIGTSTSTLDVYSFTEQDLSQINIAYRTSITSKVLKWTKGSLLIAKADNLDYTSFLSYDIIEQENYKGTVTSIIAGNGLTGGEITSTGTITVKDYNNILTSKNDALQDEEGNSIILYCGDSSIK